MIAHNWKTVKCAHMELVQKYKFISKYMIVLNEKMFFVFQLAQTETSISFPKPFIRCIGFEETLDDARSLAKMAFDEKKMETRIMPTRKVFLAGKKKYDGLDLPLRETEQLKANKMIDDWIEARLKIIAGVEQQAKEHTILPAPTFHDKVSEKPIEPDDEIQIYTRGFFALAIIPDQEEPALIALAFHTNLNDLEKEMNSIASDPDFKHLDIFAGETGKWMPLTSPKSLSVKHHDKLRQEVQGLLN